MAHLGATTLGLADGYSGENFSLERAVDKVFADGDALLVQTCPECIKGEFVALIETGDDTGVEHEGGFTQADLQELFAETVG